MPTALTFYQKSYNKINNKISTEEFDFKWKQEDQFFENENETGDLYRVVRRTHFKMYQVTY